MKRMLGAVAVAVCGIAIFFMLSPSGKKESWRPGTPLAKERVHIGVIYIANITDPSGYSYAHEDGVRAMQRECGIDNNQITRKMNVQDTDQAAIEHAMRECIVAGANIIIATSWGYMDVSAKLAKEYPGIVFAHASGIMRNDTNFTNYYGRVYQTRYLSGIAAGLRTATGKVGYVSAMGQENSEVSSGLNAFALGVEHANPRAKVLVRVTHRWFDPRGETEAARMLIAAGCDVIAQHCDTPAPQIAAQEAGVWGIGYNNDMKGDAPKAVITSVVWNWGVYYTRLVKSVMDGSFTTKPYLGDITDGMVALTPLDESLLPPGVARTVDAARQRIERGEFDVFEGPMETNDGRTVGRRGERLPDAKIFAGMNWHYRNVVEVQ